MAHISKIEGIGDAIAEKLGAAGIKSTEDLLAQAGDKKGREKLAEVAGVNEKSLLKWVNQADLQRIKGVGEEFGELLERSGVDSVPELATRNAANLAAKMAEVNASLHLVRALPSEAVVAGWIVQAKELGRAVSH
jgi:predicted flap endonuclease-1-like 5' DNA nuclease